MTGKNFREYSNYMPGMEFSAFFDLTTSKLDNRIIYLKYFLFIKYEIKNEKYIYIDVKSVGGIVMPFEELLKNKLLMMYYELSLLLVKDKHRYVERLCDEGRYWDDEIKDLYKGFRNCFIDCAYIFNGEVKTDKQYCYYDMDPYLLIDPKYLWLDDNGDRKWFHTPREIEVFNYNFKAKYGHELSGFEKRINMYSKIVIGYEIALMEKELDEIYAVEYDKTNLIKLVAFNDKKDMNCDIFQIIYNSLICSNEANRFAPLLANLENNKEATIALIASA
jgi:hypothetical protein